MAGFFDALGPTTATPEQIALNPELYNPDGTLRTEDFRGGNLPSPRIAGNLVQTLARSLGSSPKSGEVMGGEMGAAGAGARAGRQGQTIEGEIVRGALPKPGAASGPSTAGPSASAGRPAGGPPPGRAGGTADDWLEALVRERGPGPGSVGTRPGTQGSPTAAGASEGAAVAGGPPGIMEIVRGLGGFMSRGGANPSRMRNMLYGAGGQSMLLPIGGGEEAPPGEYNMPPDAGGNLYGGSGVAGTGINDILAASLGNEFPEVNPESLPAFDYEGAPEIDREGARAVLEGTAPDAPVERSFAQDLGGWIIPALAGGLLGGIPGVLLGGLMGEGRRQTDEQMTEAEYQAATDEFERGLAEFDLKMSEAERAEYMQQQLGQRQSAREDYNYERGQVEDSQQDVLNQQQLENNSLQQILGALDIAQGQNQLNMQNSFLGGTMPVGMDDNAAMLNSLIQTNPQIYNELQQFPIFEEYQLALQAEDDLRAHAALSSIMTQLQTNPQIAPILDQLRQNQRRVDFFNNL